MPSDEISFMWGRLVSGVDDAENMARYAIFFVNSLRPELKKKFRSDEFLRWLRKIYVASDAASFQADELKIIEWVSLVCCELEVDRVDESIDINSLGG